MPLYKHPASGLSAWAWTRFLAWCKINSLLVAQGQSPCELSEIEEA